jgi:hypothetical protein
MLHAVLERQPFAPAHVLNRVDSNCEDFVRARRAALVGADWGLLNFLRVHALQLEIAGAQ